MRRRTYATCLRCTDCKQEQQGGKPICIQYFRPRKKKSACGIGEVEVLSAKRGHPEGARFHRRAERSPHKTYSRGFLTPPEKRLRSGWRPDNCGEI